MLVSEKSGTLIRHRNSWSHLPYLDNAIKLLGCAPSMHVQEQLSKQVKAPMKHRKHTGMTRSKGIAADLM